MSSATDSMNTDTVDCSVCTDTCDTAETTTFKDGGTFCKNCITRVISVRTSCLRIERILEGPAKCASQIEMSVLSYLELR